MIDLQALKANCLSKKTYLSLLLGLIASIGAAHILVRSSVHGLLLNWDAMAYLSTAENLAAGKGLRNYSYDVFPTWYPPFYPIFLAFLNLFGVSVSEASRFVNIVVFGLIILLTGHWLSQYIRSSLLVIGAAVLIMTSHVITQIASYALTDTLFVLLTLLALIKVGAFLNQKNTTSFALSAFFASLTPITRYIGITVILTATILILVNRNFSILERFKYATTYAVVSSIPLSIVLVMNHITTGHYVGRRWATRVTLFESIWQVGDTLSVWFYASEPTKRWLISDYPLLLDPPSWVSSYLLVTTISVLLLGFFVFKSTLRSQSIPNFNTQKIQIRELAPPIIFTLVYITSLIYLAPRTAGQNIDFRYLAPVYVPILILIMFSLEQLWRARVQGWMLYIVKLAATSLIIFSLMIHIDRAVRWNADTTSMATGLQGYYVYGYSQNSPIIGYLNDNSINGNIFNNGGMNILYRLTDIPAPVRYISQGDTKHCLDWIESIAGFTDSSDPTYIIYFYRDHLVKRFCKPQELESQSRYLIPIFEHTDGVIYQIAR